MKELRFIGNLSDENVLTECNGNRRLLLTKEQALLKRICDQKTVTFDDLLKIKKLLEL